QRDPHRPPELRELGHAARSLREGVVLNPDEARGVLGDEPHDPAGDRVEPLVERLEVVRGWGDRIHPPHVQVLPDSEPPARRDEAPGGRGDGEVETDDAALLTPHPTTDAVECFPSLTIRILLGRASKMLAWCAITNPCPNPARAKMPGRWAETSFRFATSHCPSGSSSIATPQPARRSSRSHALAPTWNANPARSSAAPARALGSSSSLVCSCGPRSAPPRSHCLARLDAGNAAPHCPHAAASPCVSRDHTPFTESATPAAPSTSALARSPMSASAPSAIRRCAPPLPKIATAAPATRAAASNCASSASISSTCAVFAAICCTAPTRT